MDLLQSQNSLVNVGDLQNMRENQKFWQLLHGATHGLTFSQDVVWERAAETIPYSQTDFRWLFCSFGPPATSSKPKGRRTVTLRHLPRQSSPRVHAGAHGDRERLVGPLAPLPHRTILVTAQNSFITLSQKGPLGDRGNRKDQSSCRDKKPARTMPERIPQLHQIPEQCPIPKQHQIPEQQQITKQCQIPAQYQIPELRHIPAQYQIPELRQIPEQQQITKQCQIPAQYQIPEQCPISKQHQIPEQQQITKQYQIPEQCPISKQHQIPEQCPISKQHQIPEQQQITKQCQIPAQYQIPELRQIPKQHQIPEQQQITKQYQIPEQCPISKQHQIPEQQQITKQCQIPAQYQIPELHQIPKQHQIPEQQQITKQCQIPAQYQIPELRQISEQHQIKQWLWPNAPSLICKAPVNQEDLSRDQDLLKAPYISQSKTALPAHHSHDRPLGGTEQVDTGRYGCSAAYQNIYLSCEKSTQGGRVPRFSHPSVHTNEYSGSNSAVASVTIKCTETPLQPRDCLNPHTSSYVKQTMNSFQQLPFTDVHVVTAMNSPRENVCCRDFTKNTPNTGIMGACFKAYPLQTLTHHYSSGIPELQCSAKRKNGISVDSAAQHQKHLQQGFPCGPEKGTELPEAGVVPRVPCEESYWVKRCVPINCTAEMSPRPPGGSRMEARLPQGRIIGMLWQPPGHKPSLERSLLRYAVEEWMIAWKIKTSWQSITTEGLKKAFGNLHHRVRLEAIATCALRAVNGAREDQDPASTEIDHVLQELQPLLITALDDDHMQIQMAAAVCQCAIGRPSPWAREILHSTLHKGAGADVWLAAQCLAAGGGASLPVIQILLSRLFGSEVRREQEQATALLANVSTKTDLVEFPISVQGFRMKTVVRTLLAKELNCANWRNRVLSCKTIAQLKGPINKDLVNKLTQLMWKDCCSEARLAAAHALGALGRGRELHNELRVQLEEGPSSLRVEALVLLAELQIMTTRLIPSLLGCLRDDFMAVRKQACLTAAALSTKDEVIVNQLIELIQDDPVWGIKVAAITALGKIGCLTPPLQKILLQAIHCEEEPEVRIAACEAIRILRVDLPELQHLLQQRLLLETHLQVHRHIESLMKSYGFPIDRDENMVLKIKDQVQKLCSKHTITSKVLLLEELHDSQEQQMRFLGHSARPDSPPADMTELLQARYRELNRSSSVAIISRSTDNTAGIQPPCMDQELSVEEPQPTPVT